jgi:hypothetical protein
MKSRIISLAKGFSFLGHPLILGTAYVAWMSFLNLPRSQAWCITLAVVLTLTLPITVHNWRKLKSGAYANFDVSDQNQRKGFYTRCNRAFFGIDTCPLADECPQGSHLPYPFGAWHGRFDGTCKQKNQSFTACRYRAFYHCELLRPRNIPRNRHHHFFPWPLPGLGGDLAGILCNEIAIGSVFGTVVGLLAVGI